MLYGVLHRDTQADSEGSTSYVRNCVPEDLVPRTELAQRLMIVELNSYSGVFVLCSSLGQGESC